MRVLAALLVAAVLGAAHPRAHHSFAAEYDSKKPVTLTGTVTKVEWLNPHVRFYADVKDQDGAVHNWEFELGSGTSLVRQGDPYVAQAGGRHQSRRISGQGRLTARQRCQREHGRRQKTVCRIVV